MLSRKRNVVAAVVLALAVSGIHQAAAQREARKAPDFSGRVAAISADGKTLSLETRAGRGEEPTKSECQLAATTKIEFTGALKDLDRKLKVGDAVAVYLENGTPGVVQVTATPDVAGKITAVAADGKSISVEKPGPGRGETTTVEVKLTDKTRMFTPESRGGAPAPENKPQVGHSASVWLHEGSTDTAVAVQVIPPSPPGAPRGR
jgi:hypothetical protein